MFVNPKDTVTVEHGENKIEVRRKMDLATQAAVQDELLRFRLTAGGDGDDGTFDATFSVDRRNLAMLKHNIQSWSGPDFDGIACTKGNIAMLDPTEPIVQKVLETIEELNAPETELPDYGEEEGSPNPAN